MRGINTRGERESTARIRISKWGQARMVATVAFGEPRHRVTGETKFNDGPGLPHHVV